MNKLSVIALLAIFGLGGCSSGCGAMKRLMYESPGRDDWQQPGKVVAALGLEAGQVVADLGSGGGYFTFPMAEVVGRTGHVYAVDVDTSLLAYVASQSEKRDLPQIETILAPEDGLGLADGSVDLIFLSNVFHHLPNTQTYFRNARSTLRAEGRVAVVEVREAGWLGNHATPPEEIRATFEAAGYELAEALDFLEYQSFQIFRLAPDA